MRPSYKVTSQMGAIAKADKKQNRILILLVGSIVAIGPLTIDMYLPGFLSIAKDFGVVEHKISYTLTSYFFGIAIGQLLYGPILDRFGRKTPLLIGLSIYLVASVCIAFSPTLEFFILFRFIQALGASSGIVASFAIIRDKFNGQEAAKVLSSVILVMGVAPIIAPTMGSFISSHFGWRYIFYFLAFFAAVVIICLHYFLTRVKKPDESSVFKFVPILKNYFLTLKNKQFLFFNLAGSFAMAIMFAYIASIAYILLTLYEVSQQTFSLLFALNAFGFIMGGQVNRFFLRKYTVIQITYVAAFSTILISIGFLVAALTVQLPLAVLSGFLVLILFTTGFVNPNSTALSLGNVEKNIGLASALNGSTKMILGALVSVFIGMINGTSIVPMICVFIALSILAFIFIRVADKK